MNLSGYEGHVNALMITIACCLVAGLWLGLGLDQGSAKIVI